MLRRIETLYELSSLVRQQRGPYARYSKGPDVDVHRASSIDYESGLPMPGLSANPMDPEPWWTRPLEDWLARQLCRYEYIRDGAEDHRVAWLLTGHIVARGPDNEPLLAPVTPVAMLSEWVIEESKERYAERFDIGAHSFGADA